MISLLEAALGMAIAATGAEFLVISVIAVLV